MACSNPNLDLVKVKAYANFHQFFHKILCGNEIWTITKSHNYVINMRKLTRKNPNVDLVNVNACAKFDQISSSRSPDNERKRSPE